MFLCEKLSAVKLQYNHYSTTLCVIGVETPIAAKTVFT